MCPEGAAQVPLSTCSRPANRPKSDREELCEPLLGWPFPAPHLSSLAQSCGELRSSEALKSTPGWGAWLALGKSMEALAPKHPVPPMDRLAMAKHVSRLQPQHGPQKHSH